MIYINKKQRRVLAQAFDTESTRPILGALFAEFETLVSDQSSKAQAQLLMDILIRLILPALNQLAENGGISTEPVTRRQRILPLEYFGPVPWSKLSTK